MAEFLKTKSNYVKLAEELLAAQTTLMKQEVLVQGLYDTLMKKKIDVIRESLYDEYFNFNGRKYRLIHINKYMEEGRLFVSARFGILPEEFNVNNMVLTKKEKELLEKYESAMEEAWRFYHYEDEAEETCKSAYELFRLKNRIRVLETHGGRFGIEDITDPHFFEESGIKVLDYLNYEEVKLESYRCRR